MYYAHSLIEATDKNNWHGLKQHLESTGEKASDFASEFGGENAARLAGRLHDIGKYSEKFQNYISGLAESVDHSTAGAKEVINFKFRGADGVLGELISYAIAGHHAGLADKADLLARLEKQIEPIDDIWREEIETKVGPLWPRRFRSSQTSKSTCAFQIAFLGRMIFSCLVDADYRDTEAFFAEYEGRSVDRDWPELRPTVGELIEKFDAYMLEKQRTSEGPINNLRRDILQHVRSKAAEPTGLFTLTVPTGGGKTLASLGFALDHAKIHDLRRIIYAIPFTSIIDQSADIFRAVLGDEFVLEHHSSIDEGKNKNRERRDKLKLAMEDWAAPVVVTTNVQLFESLFANRPSRCRKLHNLAGSVIILDEVQTLPLKVLRPCIAALDELARNYNVSIILCTATQPAFDIRDFKYGGLELQGRELAPNPGELAKKLKRVQISIGHELGDDDLVRALAEHSQGMTIVNSRRHALTLFKSAQQAGLEGAVHLTTRQYAAHRREILARVRADLKAQKPCRLIATSLVEAGVDLDFPRVWRADAGLDQIAQAAGRCNREGRRPVDQSIVTVFKARDNPAPREIAQLAADFARMAHQVEDLLSPEAMTAYFKEVFWRKGPELLDEKKILTQFDISGVQTLFNYRAVAEDFRMIESGLAPLIVNDNPTVAAVLERLNVKEASPGKAARELQTFVVQVPPKDLAALNANGRVAPHRPDLWGDQFQVLLDRSLYRSDVGLIWENADGLENTIF